MEQEKLITVTGFGPFVGHELINASWEAVKLLPNEIEHNKINYKIEKILVPVEYEKVDKTVDDIWSKNPELVIHCGVHGGAKCLHLEKFAYNNKFCRPDYTGKLLDCSKACLENNDENCTKLSTKFDVKQIAKNINTKKKISINNNDNPLICSLDIGNYLCGYIYLKSLDKSNEKCLFIHIPPVNEPFTSKETCELIFEIIKECLDQLEKNL